MLSHGRLSRVFTQAELDSARRGVHSDGAEFLSCAFALKEAVFKALGRGWGQGMRWSDVEAVASSYGKWSVSLDGYALERLKRNGGTEVRVAVSSASGHALAQAMVWG